MNLEELIEKLENIMTGYGNLRAVLPQVAGEDGSETFWDASISEVDVKDSEEEKEKVAFIM